MRSARSYQREIRRLKQTIAEAEWYQASYNGSPSCPFCGAQQHWNHYNDCPVPRELRAPMQRDEATNEWKLV